MPSLCRHAEKNTRRKPQRSLSILQNFPRNALRRGRQSKGGKKKKDHNAPKRPPSGFFLFCSEFCPKIKSTNPGISIGDVAKKLGEMWNNLNDREKQSYINKAAKLKEKYEKDVADYKSKGKFDGAKGPAKVAWKKVEEEDEEDKEEEEEEEEEDE
ncbi:high mobility group box 3 [Saguinus oedipus]|uniref:High mobility group box 3 n=1 Tax=Saguinus oedipus TaxID=9490 RepID=A0ABQ9TB21_SAGOE|nr:high mobility group box 3 [Saguinus oedipus]